jgi:hypothetical protein
MAGHVGLELRNVVANYPFETSHRFRGIQPNSGHGDYSRLSCGVRETQLGPNAECRRHWLMGLPGEDCGGYLLGIVPAMAEGEYRIAPCC